MIPLTSEKQNEGQGQIYVLLKDILSLLLFFRPVFGDVMSPRPRREDEENESFKVPLEEMEEANSQLKQRRQIQIGCV